MEVLVTGGCGFKGPVVTEALLAAGHAVTVLDTMQYGESVALGLLRHGARVVRGDVTRPDHVVREVQRADAVLHLAGVVGFPACDADPLRATAVNVEGTRTVAAAVRPGQPFIYASTGSVYGKVEDLCTEDREPAPLTHYGRTKLEGERIARGAGGVALRFATVVGVSPVMRFDLLLNAFVYRAVHVGWLALYEPGHRRSFVDVTDAASAYLFALEHAAQMAGEAFNAGHESLNLTKQEVADAVCVQFPMRVLRGELSADPDQRDYEVAFERLAALGWRARVPLEQIITEVGAAARVVDPTSPWRFTP